MGRECSEEGYKNIKGNLEPRETGKGCDMVCREFTQECQHQPTQTTLLTLLSQHPLTLSSYSSGYSLFFEGLTSAMRLPSAERLSSHVPWSDTIFFSRSTSGRPFASNSCFLPALLLVQLVEAVEGLSRKWVLPLIGCVWVFERRVWERGERGGKGRLT